MPHPTDTPNGVSDPRSLWLLDERIRFINHGSFGACPKAVLDWQSRLRGRLESEPVQFLARDLEGLLDESRNVLAGFIGAKPENIALVPNATTGVNAVLRSLRLEPGDELLTTDHAYPSCKSTLSRVAADTGAEVVVAKVPFPIGSPQEVTDSLKRHAGPRTRICLIDHVTSPTGIVFPVSSIVRDMRDRDVDVLIDGAHAPGMLPLAVEKIGAAYYTGNCHKWICAPKGAAFLHVRGDRLETVGPLVTSLGYGSTRNDRPALHLRFDWAGTGDPTPYLCVAKAISYMGSLLPGGWGELMDRNHATAVEARSRVCARLGEPVPSPDDMIGSLASIPLPEGEGGGYYDTGDNDPVRRELLERYKIEVPVIAWPHPPKRLIRLSAQIYNKPDEYEALAGALNRILGKR